MFDNGFMEEIIAMALADSMIEALVSDYKENLKQIGISVDISWEIKNIDIDLLNKLSNKVANGTPIEQAIKESNETVENTKDDTPKVSSPELEEYFKKLVDKDKSV